MTVPVGLPQLVQSLPAIQTLANAEAAGAETQRSMMSPLIQQEIKEEKQKIEEVERRDPSTKVSEDKEGEAEHYQASERQNRPEEEDKGPPPETTSSNSSPLAGNLVNVKV